MWLDHRTGAHRSATPSIMVDGGRGAQPGPGSGDVGIAGIDREYLFAVPVAAGL
jgi:hypothetical protein